MLFDLTQQVRLTDPVSQEKATLSLGWEGRRFGFRIIATPIRYATHNPPKPVDMNMPMTKLPITSSAAAGPPRPDPARLKAAAWVSVSSDKAKTSPINMIASGWSARPAAGNRRDLIPTGVTVRSDG